jgi:hypothetical protein
MKRKFYRSSLSRKFGAHISWYYTPASFVEGQAPYIWPESFCATCHRFTDTRSRSITDKDNSTPQESGQPTERHTTQTLRPKTAPHLDVRVRKHLGELVLEPPHLVGLPVHENDVGRPQLGEKVAGLRVVRVRGEGDVVDAHIEGHGEAALQDHLLGLLQDGARERALHAVPRDDARVALVLRGGGGKGRLRVSTEFAVR